MSLTGHRTDVDLIQLLTPAGQLLEHPDYSQRIAQLGPDALRGLYRDMVLVRRFDNEATSLQRQGELGLWAQCLGQEAAQVGSGRALAPHDYAFPSYREHGVAHTRGVDLAEILRLFRGVVHGGGWDPNEHNFHLYTLVIAAHTLHATGYAMGLQRDGLVGTGDPARDAAVIVYFGDGATSQGDLNESLVFAAVNNAPIVFFCQNNQWAISEPTTKQSRVPLAHRGEGFGIPTARVDGNDVLATYAVTAQALERARSGGGPTFIEAFTYRMGAHTTSDDPTRYRSAAEDEYWRQRDPIERMRLMLVGAGELPESYVAGLEAEATALAKRVRATTKALGRPGTATLFDHVYASGNAVIDVERAWLDEYEASFLDGAAADGGNQQ